MTDYSHSKIYKLVCHTTGKMYIGSTTQPLKERLRSHEYQYKLFKSGGGNNCGSYEVLENDNYDIINILAFSCNNSLELRKKEQEFLENHPESLNIRRAYISDEDKIQRDRDRSKKWNRVNPVKQKIRSRELNRANPEKCRQWCKNRNDYQNSWGGRVERDNCSLLKIDPTLFS